MKKIFLLSGLIFLLVSLTAEKNYGQLFEDRISLDFSDTQFTFYDPMDCGFATFLFKVTNTSDVNVGIMTDTYSFNGENIHQVVAPQGSTLLEPGESMWVRTNFSTRGLNYDYKTKQDVEAVLEISMHDWLNQYQGDNSRYTFQQNITVKVSGGANAPLGEVPFNLQVLNELGNPTDASLRIVGPSQEWGDQWINPYPYNIDNSGRYETDLPMSSKYYVYVSKQGYEMFYNEYTVDDLSTDITVNLQPKTVNTPPTFTLTK